MKNKNNSRKQGYYDGGEHYYDCEHQKSTHNYETHQSNLSLYE